jgi:hypothetical protein
VLCPVVSNQAVLPSTSDGKKNLAAYVLTVSRMQLLLYIRHKQLLGGSFQSMGRCQCQFIGGSGTVFVA